MRVERQSGNALSGRELTSSRNELIFISDIISDIISDFSFSRVTKETERYVSESRKDFNQEPSKSMQMCANNQRNEIYHGKKPVEKWFECLKISIKRH